MYKEVTKYVSYEFYIFQNSQTYQSCSSKCANNVDYVQLFRDVQFIVYDGGN